MENTRPLRILNFAYILLSAWALQVMASGFSAGSEVVLPAPGQQDQLSFHRAIPACLAAMELVAENIAEEDEVFHGSSPLTEPAEVSNTFPLEQLHPSDPNGQRGSPREIPFYILFHSLKVHLA